MDSRKHQKLQKHRVWEEPGPETRGWSSRKSKGEGAERDQRRLEDGAQFMMKQGGLPGAGPREGTAQGWRLLRQTAWGSEGWES